MNLPLRILLVSAMGLAILLLERSPGVAVAIMVSVVLALVWNMLRLPE